MKNKQQYTKNDINILCGDIEAAGLDLYDMLKDVVNPESIEYEIRKINKALRKIRYNIDIIVRKLKH